MTDVPPPVLTYWRNMFGEGRIDRGGLSYAESATLNPTRPAMILEAIDGSRHAVVRPEVARRAGIDDAADLTLDDFKDRLAQAGIALHDPDHLFYLPADTVHVVDRTKAPRRLTAADRDAFARFHDAASEQDREDAFVELDHWVVFGCFDGDRLVSAASMCRWEDGPIADLGVLTLPDARGRGFARAVVGAINDVARRQGCEPQYRCQLDNHASVALAKATGLISFGKWTVATDTQP